MYYEQLTIIAPALAEVETRLLTMVDSEVQMIKNISMNLLQAGGKHLRPALYLLCARGDHKVSIESQLSVAVAIELVHMASLIHDDILDQSLLRRGQLTAHTVWGNDNGVLAGDYLFARAFFLLAQTADPFAVAQANKLLMLLSEVVAVMCEGEILQNSTKFNLEITEEQYLSIINKKTACFLAAVCEMGAISVSDQQEFINGLKTYGYFLGMAFQMADDIADFTSTAEQLGKPATSDLSRGYLTLPVIYALQYEKNSDLRNVIQQENLSAEQLQLCKKIIVASGGIEYSKTIAFIYIEKARQAIPAELQAEVKDCLWAFTDRLEKRLVSQSQQES